jgi:hypothetical protein
MTLTTMPEGTDHACFEHAAPAGFAADEMSRKGSWNYRTQLLPGADKVFKDLTRRANDALIAALKATPGLIVLVREPLAELPTDLYLNLSVVYRNGEFLETYDPTREYGPEDTIKTIDSTFGGTVTLPANTNIANVIGSSRDRYPRGFTSFIGLWEAYYGTAMQCTSLNFPVGFPDTNNLVGGHVVQGTVPTRVTYGANHVVMIFPICQRHNTTPTGYMKTITYRGGVWLDNYHNP